MAKKLDPRIAEVLKAHGFGPESAWDCHGTWVVYHHVLEQIAVKANITFDAPHIVQADGLNKVAAICVTGNMGDKTEWSIGEAAPANNKNAYPFAMAEKRGKDRVILKLIGLHGIAYSEEEADDFKGGKPASPSLLELAREAAAKGIDSYKDWYLAQSINDRNALATHHEQLKSDALKASGITGEAAA